MSKATLLKNLVNQLSDILPSHLNTFKKDFEKQCRHILTHTFTKLDLVTREEFDIQCKVLLRTRKKLEELNKHLKTCEDALNQKKSS